MKGVSLPTRPGDWRLTARAVRLVLTSPAYLVYAALTAYIGLNVFVVAQNLQLFINVVLTGQQPLGDRLSVLVGLYPFLGSAYTPLQSLLLVMLALILGVNVSMLTYHFLEHGVSVGKGGGGAAGLLLGVLGAGCAACGPAVLAGLLSVLGVSVGLTFLPLDGLEFAVAALVLLLLSTYWVADGMRGGMVRGCPVDPTRNGN